MHCPTSNFDPLFDRVFGIDEQSYSEWPQDLWTPCPRNMGKKIIMGRPNFTEELKLDAVRQITERRYSVEGLYVCRPFLQNSL